MYESYVKRVNPHSSALSKNKLGREGGKKGLTIVKEPISTWIDKGEQVSEVLRTFDRSTCCSE